MARHKKDPLAVLGPGIRIRLTEAERLSYTEKAAAAGMTLSEYFRECVMTNRTQIVARKPLSQDRRMLLYAVNKAGNNLNQLAHAAHTAHLTGKVSEATYLAILDHLQWIEQFLTATLPYVD